MGAHSEIIGNEVYVWMNGSLLYKRWLDTGQSVLFDDKISQVFRKFDSKLSITDGWLTKFLLDKHCEVVSGPPLLTFSPPHKPQ